MIPLFIYEALPPKTLIVSDKIFVMDSEPSLRSRFGECFLLTIGSPAANLFSRRINEQALFSFEVSEDAKRQMALQEQIVARYRLDPLALEFYINIAAGKAGSLEESCALSGRHFGDFTDAQRGLFQTIRDEIKQSGMMNTGYRALLREYGGSWIRDPIVKDAETGSSRLDRVHPKRQGMMQFVYNDFGLVSLAAHPYADSKCVIYVAGKHGPATAWGIHLLGNAGWGRFPYGAVFEVQIPQWESFALRLQSGATQWQTLPYGAIDFDFSTLLPNEPQRAVKAFISLPMAEGIQEASHPLISALKKCAVKGAVSSEIEWTSPYNRSLKGGWNFARDILNHFSKADLIVHDITGLAPGVMFEVGCSRALGKKTLFLWDTSRSEFGVQQLPSVIHRLDIEVVDFRNEDRLCSTVAEGLRARLEQPSEPTLENENAPDVHVVVLASPKCSATIRAPLTEQLVARGQRSFEFWQGERSLDTLCAYIGKCRHLIVFTDCDYAEGMMALGIGKCLQESAPQPRLGQGSHGGPQGILEFHESNWTSCSMFDGPKHHWDDGSIDKDLQSGLNQIFSRAAGRRRR